MANQQPPIYTTLSTARGSADTVQARLREWTDAQMPVGVNRTKLIGQAAAYAGYSLVLLGEGMCSAAVNLSAELTPAQLFGEAKIRFDAAVTAATTANDAATLNLALLGRARALLNLKQPAAAAIDAASDWETAADRAAQAAERRQAHIPIPEVGARLEERVAPSRVMRPASPRAQSLRSSIQSSSSAVERS